MAQPLSSSQIATLIEAQAHAQLPRHHWHPNGFKISVAASLLTALGLGLFFFVAPGWSPPDEWLPVAGFIVTWTLLTYIWVQLGSLVLVGAGTKNQMWLDALTSVVPLFVVTYAILQHYLGYVVLSGFQISTAWVIGYTMLLDVVVDFGVTVLLSRQVVDVGAGGVG